MHSTLYFPFVFIGIGVKWAVWGCRNCRTDSFQRLPTSGSSSLNLKAISPPPKQNAYMKTNQCPHLPFAIIHLVTLIKAIYLICQIALQSPLELSGIILSPALVPGCQIRGVEVKISFATAHLLRLCWFIPFSSK